MLSPSHPYHPQIIPIVFTLGMTLEITLGWYMSLQRSSPVSGDNTDGLGMTLGWWGWHRNDMCHYNSSAQSLLDSLLEWISVPVDSGFQGDCCYCVCNFAIHCIIYQSHNHQTRKFLHFKADGWKREKLEMFKKKFQYCIRWRFIVNSTIIFFLDKEWIW